MPERPPIRPVVLCGGAGTRLWPMSRPDRPKPLLRLATEHSLLHDTVARCAGFADPWLLCGARHESAFATEARGLRRIVEPVPRGTAAAAVAAALLAQRDDPDAVVLLAPADHAIAPAEAFRSTVERGREVAERGFLVTFGIPPRGARPGYGWIEAGEGLGLADARKIVRFVEKPDRAGAEALLQAGCLWNSGIFLSRADALLAEVRRRVPGLVDAVEEALAQSRAAADRLELGPGFADVAEGSLDTLVMEHTDRGAVVPATFRWSDIGAWHSVIEARGGREGVQVLSDGPVVQVLGQPDVLVAVTGGAVLVTTPEHAHAVGGFRTPDRAILDRGPGWQVERHFVTDGTVFAAEGATGVILAGAVQAGERLLGPGEALPLGARATSPGTWLVARTEVVAPGSGLR